MVGQRSFAALLLFLLVSCTSGGGRAPGTGGTGHRSIASPTGASSQGSSPSPSVQGFGLVSLQMSSPSVGWALSQDAESARHRVLRTTDGGSTWSDHTPSGIEEEDSGVVATFLDQSHAWVAWPHRRSERTITVTVFATADGGRSWVTSQFTSTPGWDGELQFVDPLHGWAVAVIAAGLGNDPVRVWHTLDGGKTWKSVSVSSDAYFPDLPPATRHALPPCGASTTFADRSTGFAVGGCPDRNQLYVTHDAGRDWYPLHVSPSFPRVGGPGAPRFTSRTDGFIPILAPQDQGVVGMYLTHDGGRRWARARLPVQRIEAGPAFSDPRHGWLFARGKVYATSDGGRHWSRSDTNVILAGFRLEFVDRRHGWAFGRDLSEPFLLRTEDGGRIWTALSSTIAS
jgi:photosystem II stability/assembly factor-like uncharacterized protein